MAKRNMARRVLIAQAVLVGAAVLALSLRELPGAIREVMIWRMGWRRKKK